MLTGRRAGPVLALTLAMLTLGGCRWFVPAGSYQKDGLSFDHLRGWTVKKDLQQKDVRTVIVEGPYHALFVISVFGARVDVPLETFAKSMARVRSETTKKKLTVAGLNLGAEGDAMPFLPTERSIYTVIRGPVIDKDSREHFQMLTHKRLIDIMDATSKTVQELQRLNLSAGVDIEIKL